MNERELAAALLQVAGDELESLDAMVSTPRIGDAVFGFHAQQVAEKALKAWLLLCGKEYPFTHDLDILLRLLVERGASRASAYNDLVDLNDFAVQYRYEVYDLLDLPLDRESISDQVRRLYEEVLRLTHEGVGE
jgi:HEPN domain-containing protein